MYPHTFRGNLDSCNRWLNEATVQLSYLKSRGISSRYYSPEVGVEIRLQAQPAHIYIESIGNLFSILTESEYIESNHIPSKFYSIQAIDENLIATGAIGNYELNKTVGSSPYDHLTHVDYGFTTRSYDLTFNPLNYKIDFDDVSSTFGLDQFNDPIIAVDLLFQNENYKLEDSKLLLTLFDEDLEILNQYQYSWVYDSDKFEPITPVTPHKILSQGLHGIVDNFGIVNGLMSAAGNLPDGTQEVHQLRSIGTIVQFDNDYNILKSLSFNQYHKANSGFELQFLSQTPLVESANNNGHIYNGDNDTFDLSSAVQTKNTFNSGSAITSVTTNVDNVFIAGSLCWIRRFFVLSGQHKAYIADDINPDGSQSQYAEWDQNGVFNFSAITEEGTTVQISGDNTGSTKSALEVTGIGVSLGSIVKLDKQLNVIESRDLVIDPFTAFNSELPTGRVTKIIELDGFIYATHSSHGWNPDRFDPSYLPNTICAISKWTTDLSLVKYFQTPLIGAAIQLLSFTIFEGFIYACGSYHGNEKRGMVVKFDLDLSVIKSNLYTFDSIDGFFNSIIEYEGSLILTGSNTVLLNTELDLFSNIRMTNKDDIQTNSESVVVLNDSIYIAGVNNDEITGKGASIIKNGNSFNLNTGFAVLFNDSDCLSDSVSVTPYNYVGVDNGLLSIYTTLLTKNFAKNDDYIRENTSQVFSSSRF